MVQIEFEGYVAAGTVMKSYIAILTLLLRLRQASLRACCVRSSPLFLFFSAWCCYYVEHVLAARLLRFFSSILSQEDWFSGWLLLAGIWVLIPNGSVF